MIAKEQAMQLIPSTEFHYDAEHLCERLIRPRGGVTECIVRARVSGKCAKMPAQHERGTTLLEVAVAGAILTLALVSLFALFGTTVKLAKAGDTAAIAEQNCIARIDQIRNLTWNKITDPSYIKNTLLATPTSSDNASTISSEVIRIYPAAVPQTSPLPAPTPSPSPMPGSTPFFSVTGPTPTPSSPTPTPSSPTPTPSILGERLIRVEVMTEWGSPGTTHQRQLSTLISKSGAKTR
jgi:type II secretory pathway pseudopilin PulG